MNLLGYIDGNGLVTPGPYVPTSPRGSDNGPLFTSIALILSNDIGKDDLLTAILRCVDWEGELHRAPDDMTADAPDDYYGVLAMAAFFGFRTRIKLLEARLWHPVLVYLWLLQSKYSLLARLLTPVVFLIILFSNAFEPIRNTSNRILTWTICQSLKRRSLVLGIAAKLWELRQRYKYQSHSNLFAIYYGSAHPFVIELQRQEAANVDAA